MISLSPAYWDTDEEEKEEEEKKGKEKTEKGDDGNDGGGVIPLKNNKNINLKNLCRYIPVDLQRIPYIFPPPFSVQLKKESLPRSLIKQDSEGGGEKKGEGMGGNYSLLGNLSGVKKISSDSSIGSSGGHIAKPKLKPTSTQTLRVSGNDNNTSYWPFAEVLLNPPKVFGNKVQYVLKGLILLLSQL
jgi:hypothetical protein